MAALEPGIRIAKGPRFHIQKPWIDRLRVNSGVFSEGGRALPRNDWCLPKAAELDLLTAPETKWSESLTLFNIPRRLVEKWWTIAATESPHLELNQDDFRGFSREVLEYLHFKEMPLPSSCTLEVVLHESGLPLTRRDAGGLTIAPDTGLLGFINLADEESTFVYLNLPASQNASELLLERPDYPLVRVVLEPGEGAWLPTSPILIDGDTLDRREVGVHLQIRAA